MELTYDWRTYQSFFYPRRRSLTRAPSERPLPLFLIVDEDRVVCAFADGEDVGRWIGIPIDQASEELAHRERVVFTRQQVDEWLAQSTDNQQFPHYHDELMQLRVRAVDGLKTFTRGKGAPDAVRLFRRHFFLKALDSWWQRFLPPAFGVFVRLDGSPGEDLFVVVRRGRIETFHRPELASMGPERSRKPEEVVRYLSEKHMVPVQGFCASARDWQDWAESARPWRDVMGALRAGRAQLYPKRLGSFWLVAGQSLFKR